MRNQDSYLLDSRLLAHGHGDRVMGADYIHSTYWTFVSEQTYYNPKFAEVLKMAIVILNAFNFFIRHNCLGQCLYHLLEVFPLVDLKYLSKFYIKKEEMS